MVKCENCKEEMDAKGGHEWLMTYLNRLTEGIIYKYPEIEKQIKKWDICNNCGVAAER